MPLAARTPAGGEPAAAPVVLTVAGVRLAFTPDHGLALDPPGFEYPAFLAGAPARRTVTVDVVRTHAAAPAPALPVRFDTGDGWRLRGDAGRCRAEMPDRAGGGQNWSVDWHRPLRRARARVGDALVHAGRVRHLVQYPLDQILLVEALLDDDAVLLHAAGGVTPAGGIAFAGPSGAGKSTVTRLLQRRDGFGFASDDRLFVRAGGGGCVLHGTPWAGDARVALALEAPLRALCFLRQHDATALRALSPRDALERLLPVASLPWFDRTRLDAALDVCRRLIESVACFELAFRPDAGALAGVLEDLARGG